MGHVCVFTLAMICLCAFIVSITSSSVIDSSTVTIVSLNRKEMANNASSHLASLFMAFQSTQILRSIVSVVTERSRSAYSFEDVVQKEDIRRLPFLLLSSNAMTIVSSAVRKACDCRRGECVPLEDAGKEGEKTKLSPTESAVAAHAYLLGLRLIIWESGGTREDRRRPLRRRASDGGDWIGEASGDR